MQQISDSSRKDYLRHQKKNHGRYAMGVFPATYPRELLWAMNILPIEIWDPPLVFKHSDAHLQPYICSVVKLGLELILQDKCREIDGFLFPHTCDSIQNIASMVNDYLDHEKPCFFVHHPKTPYRDSTKRYYVEELRYLGDQLGRYFGPLDMAELSARVEQGGRILSMMGELYDIRAQGMLSATNTEFYKFIRQGEYLHPDDLIPLLVRFISEFKREVRKKDKHLILSGILPAPEEILHVLDDQGVLIADDDLLSCGRRLLIPEVREDDPFEAMAERHFALPPCGTRNSSLDARLENLVLKAEKSGAKGVIFNTVKFCEPELFDIPQLVSGLKKYGIASMVIDTELNQGLSGQIKTRIEAFVEMLY